MSVKIGDIVEVKESWANGIAFQVVRNDYEDHHCSDYDEESDTEFCWVEEVIVPDRFACVMIGDDRIFSFHEEDLEVLDEEEYCGSCGQIGCGWH